MKVLLSNGNDIAKSQMQSELFFLGDYDADDASAVSGSNGGLAA